MMHNLKLKGKSTNHIKWADFDMVNVKNRINA